MTIHRTLHGYIKVTIDEVPEPLDSVVSVEMPAGEMGCDLHLRFEPTRSFYMRHMLAIVPSLLRHAWRIFLYDIKSFLKHRDKRPIETVADFEERRKMEKRNVHS